MKFLTILAAGKGSRLAPITNTTPKPLIEINGKRIIEALIEDLNKLEWDKINVVVGYEAHRFDYLVDKYGVNLVMNEEYSPTSTYYSYMRSFKDTPGGHFIVNADVYLDKVGNSIPDETTVYSYYNENPDNWTVDIKGDRVVGIYTTQETTNQIVEAYYIQEEHGQKLFDLYYSEGPTKRNLFMTLSEHANEFYIHSDDKFKGYDLDNIVDLNRIDSSYKIDEVNIKGFVETVLVNRFNLVETHNVQIDKIEKIDDDRYKVNFTNLINNKSSEEVVSINDY